MSNRRAAPASAPASAPAPAPVRKAVRGPLNDAWRTRAMPRRAKVLACDPAVGWTYIEYTKTDGTVARKYVNPDYEKPARQVSQSAAAVAAREKFAEAARANKGNKPRDAGRK